MPSHDANDLTSFLEHMGAAQALKVEENLGQGFVRLRVAEAERRQAAHDIRCVEDVIIEMLRNARDAGAHNIFVATAREGDTRTITMLDDGSGIPRDLWNAIFDARVTSKLESMRMDRWGVHGRGMALYSIKENVREARVVDSLVGGGSALRVVADATTLRERADQSKWPELSYDEAGAPVVTRGPHNIIRTCCEFSSEEQGTCAVFLGSATELIATARSRMRAALANANLMLLEDLSTLPPLQRFSVAADAAELVEVAAGCGLDISQRSAQRILSGEVKPLRSVWAQLTHQDEPKRQRTVNLAADRRGLKLSKHDSEEFLQMMERDFDYLAERYYLTLSGRPRMRVSGNRLSIFFEYEGED